jgi:hypothetical protein
MNFINWNPHSNIVCFSYLLSLFSIFVNISWIFHLLRSPIYHGSSLYPLLSLKIIYLGMLHSNLFYFLSCVCTSIFLCMSQSCGKFFPKCSIWDNTLHITPWNWIHIFVFLHFFQLQYVVKILWFYILKIVHVIT